MAIIATGSKTIIDLSDGKSLSCYLGANLPRTQIHDVNASAYQPDWSAAGGSLVITPVIYANQTEIALNDRALNIQWGRKEGSGSEGYLESESGETVSANVLTVNQNKLASVSSGLLTYIAHVDYTDSDTGQHIYTTADITFAMISTGENAKSAWISGEQIFKCAAGGAVSPSSITLTANLQNVTMSKWKYKNSNVDWTDYPTGDGNPTNTSTSLVVKPNHGVWANDKVSILLKTSDNNIEDTTSLYIVSDGATGSAGQNAKIVFLSNENITFAGDKEGKVAATTKTCNVVAYDGITKVTPTVGSATGMPTGMGVTRGSAVNNEIPLTITITADSTLGGDGQQQGTISIPVTSPVSTTLQIQWSKVNTGATGATGESAIVFSLYAPSGTVFTNGEGTLTIQTAGYEGTTAITSGATYLWQKYASGDWTTVAGQTGSSLTVNGSDVVGQATYRCQMTYNTKTYTDVITLIDKTDNYQADIDSTAGDIFKNTVGETCLICRLWQNGKEVDALKSTTYSKSAPSEPSTGDFYYQIQSNAATTKLMRYSGSDWDDVTSNATYKHTKTYKWYRRDKDGNPLDSGNTFATGKVIFVDGDDVEIKTVFVCEVE